MKKLCKKLTGIITALLMLFVSVPVSAETDEEVYTYNQFTYVYLEDDTIGIKRCDKTVETVEVPSEINGTPVTALLYSSFAWCDKMTSITIPDSVEYMGGMCFYLCYDLAEISVGNSLKYIGEDAFHRCESLKKIVLPDSVEYIGDMAFYFCSALEEAHLGNGLLYLGTDAFKYCDKLKSAYLGSSVEYIGSDAFYQCSSLEEIDIPGTAAVIGSNAFYECTSLKKAVLHEGTEYIGGGAFAKCTSLEQVNIPDSVVFLGNDILKDSICTKDPKNGPVIIDGWVITCNGRLLGDDQYVVLDDNVKGIASYAFKLSEMVSLTMSDSLLYIGDYAMNRNLKSVTFSKNLLTIGENAFSVCKELKEIDLPDSLVEVNDSFRYCGYWDDQPDGVVYLDRWVIGYKNTESLQMPENTSVVIKDGTIGIASGAFQNTAAHESQENLVSVTLPEGLLYIGDGAFQECPALSSIDLPESLLSIGTSAFAETAINEITVPGGVMYIGDYAMGYDYKYTSLTHKLREGFVIKGLSGSLAHIYALENGIDFVSTGNMEWGIIGDIDSNGKVETADAVLMKKYITGMITLNIAEFIRADVNADNKVDVFDFIILKRYLLS